eukprot:c22273_g2_i6 orf=3-287(-)
MALKTAYTTERPKHNGEKEMCFAMDFPHREDSRNNLSLFVVENSLSHPFSTDWRISDDTQIVFASLAKYSFIPYLLFHPSIHSHETKKHKLSSQM